MKMNKLIVIILCIISFLIVFNLYKNDNDNDNDNDNHNYLEHFGILNKIKKKNNKKNNKNNNNNNNKENYEDTKPSNISKYHNSVRALKSDKSGMTFEDLLKAGESVDTSKLSIESMKNELYKYNKSFSKEKFKNNSKNTTEAFDKFALYKEKFFELFK